MYDEKHIIDLTYLQGNSKDLTVVKPEIKMVTVVVQGQEQAAGPQFLPMIMGAIMQLPLRRTTKGTWKFPSDGNIRKIKVPNGIKVDLLPKVRSENIKPRTATRQQATRVETLPATKVPTAPATKVPTAPATKVPTAPATKVPTAPATKVPTAPATKVPTAPATKVPTAPATKVPTAPAEKPYVTLPENIGPPPKLEGVIKHEAVLKEIATGTRKSLGRPTLQQTAKSFLETPMGKIPQLGTNSPELKAEMIKQLKQKHSKTIPEIKAKKMNAADTEKRKFQEQRKRDESEWMDDIVSRQNKVNRAKRKQLDREQEEF